MQLVRQSGTVHQHRVSPCVITIVDRSIWKGALEEVLELDERFVVALKTMSNDDDRDPIALRFFYGGQTSCLSRSLVLLHSGLDETSLKSEVASRYSSNVSMINSQNGGSARLRIPGMELLNMSTLLRGHRNQDLHQREQLRHTLAMHWETAAD